MKSARRETTSMAEAGRVFVNNKAGGKKQTSSLREREKEEEPTPFSSASNGADAPSEGGW